MKIRKVTKKDCNQLLPLLFEQERFHLIDLEKEEISKEGLERESHSYLDLWFEDNYQGYVLEDSGKLVGFVLAQTGEVIGKGWIEDIYVEGAYRGKGWAEKLLQTAIDWLKSKGVKTVRLEVNLDNARARSFYKRLGFAERPPINLLYEKQI